MVGYAAQKHLQSIKVSMTSNQLNAKPLKIMGKLCIASGG